MSILLVLLAWATLFTLLVLLTLVLTALVVDRCEVRTSVDYLRRWWRGQCNWCGGRRLRYSPVIHRGSVHAFVAVRKGICYDCAKAWVHTANYGGWMDQRVDQELLAQLRRTVERREVRRDATDA